MDIAATAGVGTRQAIADRQLIADNLDTFLQLLITQLRNQDPLEPIDTNEFTAQLVQFSQVEQGVKSNDLLEKLVASQTGSASQTALGYIGKVVTADGATQTFADGGARWTLAADEDASATFTVRDQTGAIVFTQTGSVESGSSVFVWDGTTSTGQRVRDGLYTLGVDARDGAGGAVKVSTRITGLVRGADFDGSEPMLDVGGVRVRLSTIGSVTLPDGA
jgi:flagellar basal-body rod modification protein FlgD